MRAASSRKQPYMTHLKTFLIASLALAGIAQAHVDVGPYVANSKIVTGGKDDGTGETFAVIRSYGYDFGEDAANPYFIGDPGFNAAAGSGLPQGSQLRFDVLSSLRYWDGTGEPAFSAAPAGESIAFNFGASTTTVTSASGAQPGFNLQTVGANGALHRHLNTTFDGTPPAEGVYAVLLDLASSDAAIARSDPFYVVFNNGLSEAQHDAAIDVLGATLVPEPATLAGFAGAGVLLLRRRR